VLIDPLRNHWVGKFLADYIVQMGVVLRDLASFFACKVAKVRGITRSTASVKVANSMMRDGCKRLIEAVGLDSTRYASHSCKMGAALTAMEAGLSHVQIQDLGRWASSSMVLRYAGGDLSARQAAAEAVRIWEEVSSSGGTIGKGVVLRLGVTFFFFFLHVVGQRVLQDRSEVVVGIT
jgi:hypothetical protein